MGIPDRWRDYVPFGKVIKETRIFALKVPLKQVLTKTLEEKEVFTPDHVIQKLENLGLIIDLTNTFKYYSGMEFVNRDVLYQKIKCEGHVVPSLEVVTRFFAVMDSFLNTVKDKLVGIHCTHGLNRTGYLVCRYLIQRLGYSPKDAIEAFNTSRGHEIERENYLKDLIAAKWKEIEVKTDLDLTKCDFLPTAKLPTQPSRRRNDDDHEWESKRKRRRLEDDRHDGDREHFESRRRLPSSRGQGRYREHHSQRDQYSNDRQWHRNEQSSQTRRDEHSNYRRQNRNDYQSWNQWPVQGYPAPWSPDYYRHSNDNRYSQDYSQDSIWYNQQGGYYDGYQTRSSGADNLHGASHSPDNSN